MCISTPCVSACPPFFHTTFFSKLIICGGHLFLFIVAEEFCLLGRCARLIHFLSRLLMKLALPSDPAEMRLSAIVAASFVPSAVCKCTFAGMSCEWEGSEPLCTHDDEHHYVGQTDGYRRVIVASTSKKDYQALRKERGRFKLHTADCCRDYGVLCLLGGHKRLWCTL